MRNGKKIYEIQEDHSRNVMTFFFVSKGNSDIIKAIQYNYLQELNGRNLFNLGFGDYDIANDLIIDDVDSNNNDVYKVFNTVLYTIPIFFAKHKNDYLMVSGSDGHKDFIKRCIVNCKKNCSIDCKKYKRRINIYKGYVDKYFESLSIDYQFFGGTKDDFGNVLFVNYEKYKNYDSILLLNKKL